MYKIIDFSCISDYEQILSVMGLYCFKCIAYYVHYDSPY